MRFAYVAAGAVVLGAAVSEARSVPSSPQRTPKAAKRQSRQAGLRSIQPLTFGNPAIMQASKTLPSNTPFPDGISDDEMVNQNDGLSSIPKRRPYSETVAFPQLAQMANSNGQESSSRFDDGMPSASPIAPANTSPPRASEELDILNINPTGVPEYVVMQAPSTQGDMARSDIPNAPRRYLPSPLNSPMYMLENVGKALPEPASQAFETIYSSVPPQIQTGPQRLPMSTETSIDALLDEIKKITNEQSDPSNPMPLPNSPPPPPPLLRALGDDHVPMNPTAATTLPCDKISQVPSPLAPTAEITSNATAPNDDVSVSSPASQLPAVDATMGDSERATLTTPVNVTLPSPAGAAGSTASTPFNATDNSTAGDSERATLATPAGANVTHESPLTNNTTSSIHSNDTDSSQISPSNATNASPIAS